MRTTRHKTHPNSVLKIIRERRPNNAKNPDFSLGL
jgi:hypothetical protein